MKTPTPYFKSKTSNTLILATFGTPKASGRINHYPLIGTFTPIIMAIIRHRRVHRVYPHRRDIARGYEICCRVVHIAVLEGGVGDVAPRIDNGCVRDRNGGGVDKRALEAEGLGVGINSGWG